MNNISTQDTDRQTRREPVTYANYNIRGFQVKIIGDGKADIMSRDMAIALAQGNGLDLVQISYDKNARMPVCKIIDYGKFKYEQTKREKEIKKQARANAIELKTIQFSVTTDDGDKTRLIARAREFLNEGDNVKLTIRFRNKRESMNLDFAKNLMREILVNFEDIAILDAKPELNGRELACVLRKVK